MARPFKICPDCGAPYHRECYEKLGRCIHTPAHGAGYEWTFPYKDDALRTCPSCGERTLRTEERCRCCGAGPAGGPARHRLACAFGWCVMLAFEVPYYFWTCREL